MRRSIQYTISAQTTQRMMTQKREAQKYPLGLDTSAYKSNKTPKEMSDNPYIKKVDASKYKKPTSKSLFGILKEAIRLK